MDLLVRLFLRLGVLLRAPRPAARPRAGARDPSAPAPRPALIPASLNPREDHNP